MGASPELSEGSADHKFLVNREAEKPDPRGRCEASCKRSKRLGGKERGLRGPGSTAPQPPYTTP